MNTHLKEYLREKDINITQLAKLIGVSRGHLSTVANGKPGGKNLASRIEKWSNGEITCIQILYPEKK